VAVCSALEAIVSAPDVELAAMAAFNLVDQYLFSAVLTVDAITFSSVRAFTVAVSRLEIFGFQPFIQLPIQVGSVEFSDV